MVIFFDLITKEILYTENGKTIPALPIGTLEEKKQILERQNIGFIGVPYEMDLDIFNYLVNFENGVFTGLQLKGGI